MGNVVYDQSDLIVYIFYYYRLQKPELNMQYPKIGI